MREREGGFELLELTEDCADGETLLSLLSALDETIFPHSAWGREAFLKNMKNSYDRLLLSIREKREATCLPGGVPAEKNTQKQVLGYALLRILDDAELLLIGVAEDCRGQGIGRALLETILTYTEDRDVFLEVRESNAAAIGLYRSCGFEQIAKRVHYYKEPFEDALILRREKTEE